MKSIISMLLAVALGATVSLQAESMKAAEDSPANQRTIRVNPDGLGAVIVGEKLKLMLKDGTYAEGRATDATSTDITLQVRKMEPKNRFSRSTAVIPVEEISVIHFTKSGSTAIPAILGIGGFVGGMLAGAAVTILGDTECENGACIAVPWMTAIGGAALGVYGGKKLGEQTITVYVNSAK